ncbi:MAG: hypothetical protein KDC15_12990 [Chitinophagaceae bacterium]|nr:hypothetical protein [Chitinophagaceae bacterium]
MKKLIFILVVSILLYAKSSSAQIDTSAVIQNIVNNKSQFIGQPFSILYNQLPIQIKYYFPWPNFNRNRYQEPSTSFSFYFPQNTGESFLTYPGLRIYWHPFLNRSQSVALYTQGRGAWTSAVALHYGSAIISDIRRE